MERVCTWVFLAAVALVSSVLAAPASKVAIPETITTCKDGDVPAAILFKAADMQSETDRRLKTIRSEKEVLHAQVCGDSDNFQASLDAARQETARMIAQNGVDVLAASGASRLVELIEIAGLTDTLRSQDNITIFAPSDQAIEELPEETVKALTSNPGALAEVLQYHVVPQAAFAKDLKNGAMLPTLGSSNKLHISVKDWFFHTMVNVQCARVVKADQGGCNGVVHVINKTITTCKDGDVPAAILFKAADMQSETDRRLKTIRAEKEVLHAQVCGDSDNFQASLDAARQETARMIEDNRRRCETELTSIIPTMTKSVINVNLLEAIREAMRTVIDAHFNPEEEEEEEAPPELDIRSRVDQCFSVGIGVFFFFFWGGGGRDFQPHLCPTGKATSEALLAVGEAIGRATVEYEAIRQLVVQMKGGTCPSHSDMDMEGDAKWCTGVEIGSICYFLSGAQLPFSLGSSNCQEHDGQMAMVKNPRDYDPLRAFLMSLSVGDIWIGATDYDGDMTFTWLDGTTLVDGAWGNGEPNNVNQKCAQMWRYVNLKLDDDYCTNRKNILCMKERLIAEE
uniref:C-type lectin domain-containing protein n=1 Tax=Branchiostoma floridae TaxID=7739 RepID=C3Z462_BRAFL|eukprot:XP_002596663.1 hypothetical protein BRAFLDRAFT_78440 [Branchiostoma floridae]